MRLDALGRRIILLVSVWPATEGPFRPAGPAVVAKPALLEVLLETVQVGAWEVDIARATFFGRRSLLVGGFNSASRFGPRTGNVLGDTGSAVQVAGQMTPDGAGCGEHREKRNTDTHNV